MGGESESIKKRAVSAPKFDIISCDKGLVNAAKQFNVKNVNPDIMTSNVDTRRSRTSYFATVKKAIQEKKKQVNNNTSTILKPGQKIIWSLTT